MPCTNGEQSCSKRKIWIPPPALTSSGKSRTSSKKNEKLESVTFEDRFDLSTDNKVDTQLKNVLKSIQKLKDEISKSDSEKQLLNHQHKVSAMTISLEKVRDTAEQAVQKLQNVQLEKARIENALESVQRDLLTKAEDNQKLINQRDILSSRLTMVEESAEEAIKGIVPIGEFVRKINDSQEDKISENYLQEITAKLLHLVNMNKLIFSPKTDGGGDDLKVNVQQNGINQVHQLKHEIESLQMRLHEDRAKIDDLQKTTKKVRNSGLTDKEREKSSLRIQKERANKYLSIIETLKFQAFQKNSEISQLYSEMNCLKLQNSQLKNENDRLEVDKNNVYRDLMKNNSDLSKKDIDRVRMEDLTTKLSQSVLNAASFESEKLKLQESLSKANIEIQELKSEINNLKIEAKVTSVKNTQTSFSKVSERSELSQKDMIFGKAIWEELQSDKKNIIQLLKDLENKLEISQQTNSEFRKEIYNKDDALNQIHLKLQEKIDENQSLRHLLESALNDVKKYSNFIDQKAVLLEQANGSRISELEKQLFDCRHERDQLFREMSEMELRCINQVKEMQERLELAEKSKSTMQDYVKFLKTSYANVFSDCLTSQPFRSDL